MVGSALKDLFGQIELFSAYSTREGHANIGYVIEWLEKLKEFNQIRALFLKEQEFNSRQFGQLFLGEETDWGSLADAIKWARELKNIFKERVVTNNILESIFRTKVEIDDSRIKDALGLVRESLKETRLYFYEDNMFKSSQSLAEMKLTEMVHKLEEFPRNLNGYEDWLEYSACKRDFSSIGLGEHFKGLEREASELDKLENIVKKSFFSHLVERYISKDPNLTRFKGKTHEEKLREFCDLDRKYFSTGPSRVIQQVNAMRPNTRAVFSGSEVERLKKESVKKRRHMPIRILLGEMPALLHAVKPCVMMSPLSVSQYVDPSKVHFDLVIFDEASQIFAEDAVCAIVRGDRVVVCGDSKQLPPTSFFMETYSDDIAEDDYYEEIGLYESILDECKACGIPDGLLNWHYRSRHESLIAFSNHRFYDNRLFVFPASNRNSKELGIQFNYVEDGVYDRGKTSTNMIEAESVIDTVIEVLKQHPDKTVGVVTFSVSQKNLIEDLIFKRVRQNPSLEGMMSGDRLNGFFVKNLENVQGDERDIMIFSVCYGKDMNGKLHMNFGPLNIQGGERRLNVAITRAKEKVIIVSSIKAGEMDLSRTGAPGVMNLCHYLDYAERGMAAYFNDIPGGLGDYESPFEESVAGAIRTLGYDVVPQVGCAGFRIDLGVVDPNNASEYILGIECDGASYHSSAVARDRDRLRQEVLERLGWRIHRIWSPDWVKDRAGEIERLSKSAKQAQLDREKGQSPKRRHSSSNPESNGVYVKKNELSEPGNFDPSKLEWTEFYEILSTKKRLPDGVDFTIEKAYSAISSVIMDILKVESPIHKEILFRRTINAYGFKRVTEEKRNTMDRVLDRLKRKYEIKIMEGFVWLPNDMKTNKVRIPNMNDMETLRSFDNIPIEEIVLAITGILDEALSMQRDDLIQQIARLFGYDRTSAEMKARIEKAIKEAEKKGEDRIRD